MRITEDTNLNQVNRKSKIHLTSKHTLITISNTDNIVVDLFPCIGTTATATQSTHIHRGLKFIVSIYFMLCITYLWYLKIYPPTLLLNG